MKKIFISRDLKLDSIFKTKLENAGYEVWGASLLEFELIPFEKIPSTDWIFFYSQKGVQFFFNHIQKQQLPFSKKIKLASFGKKTAKAIESFGIPCHFKGTGDAKITATQFLAIAKNKKVLFPRAEISQKSIQQLLEKKMTTQDLVIYKNFPKAKIDIPKMDLLVFTSPLNAKVFFEKYKFEKDQKVFAIGKTTAKTLAQLGIEKVFFPKKPSEKKLVNLILKKNN